MLLLVSLLVVSATAHTGYDFIQSTSTSTFTCIKNNGISFVIPRIFKSSGHVDTTGVQNVKNARSAGFTDVDGYLFPCHTTSCGTGATQVSEAITAIKNADTSIGTLWLDIERYNWPSDHTTNREFIESMVAEAKKLGQDVGIYSNYNNWEAIVGLDYHGQSSLKLWWAEYDGVADFSRYKEFGGWTTPHIHQYKGTTSGSCSMSVDLNYKA